MKKALSEIQKQSEPENNLLNICLASVFIILVFITIIIRIRTLGAPLDRDEGEYAYAGQLMLQGVPPYSLAYNMKMPGIYAAYAVILAIFGQTSSGIHFAVLIINTATILLIFLLTRKLFGPIGGLAAATFFAITSISSGIQATANAENFVVLPAIAGIILLMKFTEGKKLLWLITGSLLLGIAFMMKQHGAGFILFGLFWVLWNQFREKPTDWKRTVLIVLIYCFFVVLPFLITCLVLWYYGVFKNFWFWTFTYARHYVSVLPAYAALGRLNEVLMEMVPSAWFVWLSGLFGLLSITWNKQIRKHSIFLTGFYICSFLMVCPGLYFRQHYFVLFLPVICILASTGIIAIRDLLSIGIKSRSRTAFISILIILAVWLQSFYSQRDYLLETDPVRISRANFTDNPFPEAVEIARYIKDNSSKDDTIAVLGSEPEIFFYSQRRSATAYIYTYPLMEPQPYAVDMQREMIRQIETARPRFLVYVKFYSSWMFREDSEKLIVDWLEQYVPSHYRQRGIVEIITSNKTLYNWNPDAKPLKEEHWIFVGERID